MALVTSNDSTNVSGRIGEVVYVPYKGGTYVRKAPKKRKESRTPAMLLNQQRFACMHRFCVQFKHTLIPQVWNNAEYYYFASNETVIYVEKKKNTDELLKSELGSLEIIYEIK